MVFYYMYEHLHAMGFIWDYCFAKRALLIL